MQMSEMKTRKGTISSLPCLHRCVGRCLVVLLGCLLLYYILLRFVSLAASVLIWIDVHTSCNRGGSVDACHFLFYCYAAFPLGYRDQFISEFVLDSVCLLTFSSFYVLSFFGMGFSTTKSILLLAVFDSSLGFAYTFLFGSCIVYILLVSSFFYPDRTSSTLSYRVPDSWIRYIFYAVILSVLSSINFFSDLEGFVPFRHRRDGGLCFAFGWDGMVGVWGGHLRSFFTVFSLVRL